MQTIDQRLARLEQVVEELSGRIRKLETWRDFEIRERAEAPSSYKGQKVIGRIPIWGSGRYLLVLKTPRDKFGLEID